MYVYVRDLVVDLLRVDQLQSSGPGNTTLLIKKTILKYNRLCHIFLSHMVI